MLGGQTPAEWVVSNYVEGDMTFKDSNWKCPASQVPQRNHRLIVSFADYQRAMRESGSQGDLLILATFQRLFQLRVIVASSHPSEESLDYDSAPPPSFRRTLTVTIDDVPHASVTVPTATDYFNIRLSSKMPIILIQSPIVTDCYDWAHAESDLWNGNPPSRVERATLTTQTPIHQVFNPNLALSPPDLASIPVSIDIEMRPRPNAVILQVADEIRRREEVRCHLIEEEGMDVGAAENLPSVYERKCLCANLKSLPSLRRMIANIKACRDPLARAAELPQ
jgi:hypothetical protein